MSKKSTSLPSRPEIPSVDEIVEDMKGASQDDIAFTARGDIEWSPSRDVLEAKDGKDLDQNEEDSPEEDISPNIETMYNQALQFIKLTEELREAPESLKQQSEHLKLLGTELSKSIGSLKDQSQRVYTETKSRCDTSGPWSPCKLSY